MLAEELLAPALDAPGAPPEDGDDDAAGATLRAVAAVVGEKLEKMLQKLIAEVEGGAREAAAETAYLQAARYAKTAAKAAQNLAAAWGALFVARWSALVYEAKAADYRA